MCASRTWPKHALWASNPNKQAEKPRTTRGKWSLHHQSHPGIRGDLHQPRLSASIPPYLGNYNFGRIKCAWVCLLLFLHLKNKKIVYLKLWGPQKKCHVCRLRHIRFPLTVKLEKENTPNGRIQFFWGGGYFYFKKVSKLACGGILGEFYKTAMEIEMEFFFRIYKSHDTLMSRNWLPMAWSSRRHKRSYCIAQVRTLAGYSEVFDPQISDYHLPEIPRVWSVPCIRASPALLP